MSGFVLRVAQRSVRRRSEFTRATSAVVPLARKKGGGKKQREEENRDSSGGSMTRGVKKENLETKICVVCNGPFTWRKKWERCWDEVTTCSKACNAERRRRQKTETKQSAHSLSSSGSRSSSSGDTIGSNHGSSNGQKPCTLCGKETSLLVRCQTDRSRTWEMVCGKCWKIVSGGVPDGDAAHPFYKYGGLWKNRRA